VSAFVDTDVLVRHLIGDPPNVAARATAYIQREPELFLADLVIANTIHVLESFYEIERANICDAMRALIVMESARVIDEYLLLRALEIYEKERLGFGESYLIACAESTGVAHIASFDQSLDHIHSVQRVEP
jgi:predicted nucleic-acid-binding protein